ncbi:MAG: carbohydrate ABC transporter permease [Acidimicrobiia bacterium]|nr:carbohydrate ABC transporter permease [Acidimicrobiia bacterium]
MATADTITEVETASKVELGSTPTNERPGRRNRVLRTVGWYALLSVLAFLVLFPVWMTIVRALSASLPYLSAGQPVYPVEPEWDIFSRAWSRGNMGRHLLISAAVTLIIAIAQLVTSVLAAYAFAFLRFPFKRVLFAAFIATLMLPIEVTLVPNIEIIDTLGWKNTIQGLTVPFLATAIGTFLIRQGFLGIPKDLRDAARLDGFGNLQFLWRVAIPVTRPVIASFAVISFLAAWNQYLWPRAITQEEAMSTVQIILRPLAAAAVGEFNIGPAAAIIAALPILILLIVFQRQLVRGLTAGAVKG